MARKRRTPSKTAKQLLDEWRQGDAYRLMQKWRGETTGSKLQRGAKREFDRTIVQQLSAQYPKATNKQLAKKYKELIGTEPSVDWVRKHRHGTNQ